MIKQNKQARITVNLPKKACQEIRERMLLEGYSLRGKSKWYSEAIEEFLKLPNFYDYVDTASWLGELTKSENLYIPKQLDDKLENSIIKVRKKFPMLEGVKSLIVRASVIQRLLKPLTNKPKV